MRPICLALLIAVSLPTLSPAQALPRRQRRALLEAASSYRQPGAFYLIGATVPPYTVIDAYSTRGAADSAATRAGPVYHVYGPYTGPTTPDPWEVLSITVRVRTAGGERTLEYNPRTVDAVFLSTSAVQKFLIPYYKSIYGPRVADSLLNAVRRLAAPAVICHAWSIPCTADTLLWLPATAH